MLTTVAKLLAHNGTVFALHQVIVVVSCRDSAFDPALVVALLCRELRPRTVMYSEPLSKMATAEDHKG